MKQHINSIALAFAVLAIGALPASAEQFANKKHNTAIEIIDTEIPGADRFVFYCWPAKTHCGGERYTTERDGKMSVTFQYGERNTIRFWPDGKRYRMEHVKSSSGQVTKMALEKTSSKPEAIPDLTLFNPNWGAAGTKVTVGDGVATYCFDRNPCVNGTLHVVGDRLALVDLGNNDFLLLGRFGPNKEEQPQYSVSFHRNDGQSFQSPFVVMPETTSALE